MGSAAELASRGSSGGVAPPDRFNLLLLEDGEYYFKGHTAYYWPEENKRVFGSLKVCSRSLFFVPRDVHQPIFRIPFLNTTSIQQLPELTVHGEEVFEVAAGLRVDMKVGNTDGPYQQDRGDWRFRFSLLYASLDDVLPQAEELWELAVAGGGDGGSKEQRAEAARQLEEIIKEHEESELFNPGWLEDEESLVVEAVASAITPLAAQPGRAVLTQQRIYFQPFNLASASGAPIQAYLLERVVAVMPRVYQLEDLGLEVFFSARHSLYLAFRRHEDRDAFRRLLMQQPALRLEKMRSREQWTRDWVNGRISNFDYLMHLNREAGRSFKDLSQYPVMPWVLSDYTSPTLDLSDPSVYRDLSKPIGALTPRRLQDFQARFQELKQMAAAMGPGAGGGKAPPPGAPPPLDMPPFLYGCHYSSPGYVVFYLMRSDPQLMLRLQNGRFDSADRLFWSIADTWKSVLTLPSDVKELVPEFYSNDTAFLMNKAGIDFGCRSGGQRVGDVQLPPWASDAADFLYKQQEALESAHVSSRLHKWIDLIFGRKARGPRAEEAHNVFHYLTYDEVARRFLDQEADPGMRDALRLQMMEFGRTPRQLFTRKHPKRKVLGSGGVLACFACFVAPQLTPQPSNILTGKPFDARSIPPVSRAVFKLSCSPKRDKREALLHFLEHTAAHGEPDALALRQTRGAELVVLVKAVREAKEGRGPVVAPAQEMLSNLVRAVAALAVCPQNRRYILEAGCLDGVAEAVEGSNAALAAVAVQALARLCHEESPRLLSLDQRVLARLLSMLRDPAASLEAQLAALVAITHLAEYFPAHRAYFAREGLLDLLLEQLRGSEDEDEMPASVAQAQPTPRTPRPNSRAALLAGGAGAAAGGVGAGAGAGEQGTPRLKRRNTLVHRGQQGPADTPVNLVRGQRLLAIAALLLDDGQKEAVLGSQAALPALLEHCSSSSMVVRGGAYECSAALTGHDSMRQLVKEQHLLPLLLDGTACTSAQVQRPAAACIANLCADPGLMLEELSSQPSGFSSVVALALSPDSEVQRHAAAALWQLAVQPEARRRAVEAGALNALLSLARLPRNVAARDLARQVLLRCSDDEGTRGQLEQVAAATGVGPGQLALMLTPSSTRSASFYRNKPRHRKFNSEVPSSYSGALSRSSSYKSMPGSAGSPQLLSSLSTPQDLRLNGSLPLEGRLSGTGAPLNSFPIQLSPDAAFPESPPLDLVANGKADSVGAADTQREEQQQQQQQPPTPLQLPDLSDLPEGIPAPLPLITPVAEAPGEAGTPPARHQLSHDVALSAGAKDAADSSPPGGVARTVRSLERVMTQQHPA